MPWGCRWSSSFESYNENDNIVTNNTTGALDTFSSFSDPASQPLIAAMPVSGVELATGLAANVTHGVSGGNGAVQFDRANLTGLADGGTWVISFDLQQRQWSSNQLGRAYSGGTATSSFATAGNFGTGAMRSFWVINRTGSPIDLPHNLIDGTNPDAVDPATYSAFSRRLNGTLFTHPSASSDVTLSPITIASSINRFLYNDNGGGTNLARDDWYDNFIITDSVDDAFIGPDGTWRSVLDLTVGTRPTSSYLASGTSPSVTGSVVNSVDFTPTLNFAGTAIVNGSVLDVTNSDAGWLAFTQPVDPPDNETVVLLDLDSSSGQSSLDYVINELAADADLRGYTLTTDHWLLGTPKYAGFDVALSFFDLAPGDFNFSLRLGGDGLVFLDQFAVSAPAPIPEPASVVLLAGVAALMIGRRRSRRIA